MDKIDHFRLKHKKISIELSDLSTSDLIDNLEERKLDFIVDSTPIETIYNNIEIKPICSLNTCFVKSIHNKNNIKSLKNLQKENIILPVSRSSLRKNLNKCFNEANIEINPILEFQTEELIIDATRRNLGVGYVVESAIKYLVDAKILEYVNIKEELPKMEINLVFISNYLSNVAKLFIEEEINNES